MNKDFSKLAKSVLDDYQSAYEYYPDILRELDKRIDSVVDIKEENGADHKPSGYIITEVKPSEHLYTSMRIGDHLPLLENYIKHNPQVPIDSKYAHICLLFLGYEVWRGLKSEKGNYVMGAARTTARVPLSHAAYSYYKDRLPLDILYRIYHFIPEFVVESDLDALGDAANQWLAGRGENEFIVPAGLSQDVYYKKHRQSGTASIDCMMHIEIDINSTKPMNEARAEGGIYPLMSFDMGRVVIVSPDSEEMALRGTLDVWSADTRDIDMLMLFSQQPASNHKNGKSKLDKKRFLESLMPEIERIITENLEKYDI